MRALKSAALAVILVTTAQTGFADETPPELNWTAGPATVLVGKDLAKLNLPKGYLFINGDDTRKLMKFYKEPTDGEEVGTIIPNSEDKDWSIMISYSPMGYVKDDDAGKLDPDAMLESLKEGTEQANEERKRLGGEPIHITGWNQKPHYDPKTHNLVWAINAQSERGYDLVNYNTRILGRGGVTSIVLVADPKELAKVQPELENVTSNYSYVTGQKYAEFIPGKDKVAEIGLAALILGGTAAAAKTGLLTKIGLFLLLAFKKIWFVLVVGLFGGIKALGKKLFGKKEEKVFDISRHTQQERETETSQS